MRLPDGSGIDLIAEINAHYPNTPVAMITAFGNVDAAVEALKAGAFDFVSKPVDLAVLRGLVKHALDLPQKGSKRAIAVGAASDVLATRLYGNSPAIVSLKQTLGKVARSQAPVYIAGESGVGKELVARTIHEQGARGTGPFVPVNCGAIPAELMESEFFGHKKGSFTGAHVDKPGLFQAADGGTLFLDEVAELPLPMQVKLLRAIQEKSIRPVGANTEVLVGRAHPVGHAQGPRRARRRRPFPPRPVLPHQRHRTARAAAARTPRRPARPGRRDPGAPRRRQNRPVPALTDEANAALLAYPFPGNVRELENILERALALAEDDRIEAADLRLPTNAPSPAAAPPPLVPAAVMPNRDPMVRDPRTADPRDSMTSALPVTSRRSSATRSSRRSKTTATTRPRRRRHWGSRSARCGTS
jgi:two-component system response regulator PilR (NtrC family)